MKKKKLYIKSNKKEKETTLYLCKESSKQWEVWKLCRGVLAVVYSVVLMKFNKKLNPYSKESYNFGSDSFGSS